MLEMPLRTPSVQDAPRPAAPKVRWPGAASPIDPAPSIAGKLEVMWARDDDEVREAQRLRYRVFVEEMGARIAPPPGTPAGLDADLFDPFCEHLLVRSEGIDGEPGEVVGTYRVLTPASARRVGGLYSDGEFDLTRLRSLRQRMAELGRSCVDADHRSGRVIHALSRALGAFMVRNGLDTMIGCASVGMRDGGRLAAGLWRQLSQTHLAPIEWQVRPRLALPVDEITSPPRVEPPALIKGYLRCGAMVLGAPAWDPQFNTADMAMLLRIGDLPPHYRRHFLGI